MSRSEHLRLPRPFYDQMVQHAQTELPNECCGLLAGVRDQQALHVKAWYPLVNEAASPTEFHCEGLIGAFKDMRQHGHEILSIYHSHPTSEPIPSKKDLERNNYPTEVHLIIGLRDPEPLVRAWWLSEHTFEEAAWQIVES